MMQPTRTLQLNRALVWLVPLIAIAFVAMNRPGSIAFGVKEVSVLEAKSLIEAGAIVVDVRDKDAFQARHLPGAVSVPVSQLRTTVPAALAEAKDKSIVVYCGDGAAIGPEGTRLLNDAGFARAVNLKSGLNGWQKAGNPVDR